MNAALLNTPIMFEKNTVTVDGNGNHKNVWVEEFMLHATLSNSGGGEEQSSTGSEDREVLNFTVRYCRKASAVTTDGYRIRMGDGIYNIVSIDLMNNRHRCIKFRCRKERR